MGFLNHLAGRAIGANPSVRPALPSRFAPWPAAQKLTGPSVLPGVGDAASEITPETASASQSDEQNTRPNDLPAPQIEVPSSLPRRPSRQGGEGRVDPSGWTSRGHERPLTSSPDASDARPTPSGDGLGAVATPAGDLMAVVDYQKPERLSQRIPAREESDQSEHSGEQVGRRTSLLEGTGAPGVAARTESPSARNAVVEHGGKLAPADVSSTVNPPVESNPAEDDSVARRRDKAHIPTATDMRDSLSSTTQEGVRPGPFEREARALLAVAADRRSGSSIAARHEAERADVRAPSSSMIRISIGSIEVRTQTRQPAAPPAVVPPGKTARRAPRLSLDEYLNRSGRSRP
jgi:hypothetical protein